MRTCDWQEPWSFVLGSYAAASSDYPDSDGLHAFLPYVTINGADDQPESIASGSRIKFVFSVRFRGFEYCYAPATIFSVGDVPRRQCKSFNWLCMGRPSSLSIGQWSLSWNAPEPASSVDTERHVDEPHGPPDGIAYVLCQFRFRAVVASIIHILPPQLRA